MATDDGGWYDSQQKRMERETLLSGTVVGMAFLGGFANWQLILVGVMVLFVQLIRRSAVNTGEEEYASGRLFITNPVLVHGSLIVVFYALIRAVQVEGPTESFVGQIALFTLLSGVLALLILLAEYLGNGEYFEWWKDRAITKSSNDDTGFWMYIAARCKQVSPIAVTEEELKREKRKGRAKQRLIEGKYTPFPSIHNPPSREWAWLKPLAREAVNWRRLLPITAGIIFFASQGFVFWKAATWSVLVWFASSLLVDHIKYWYYFRPVRDGHYEERVIETLPERLVHEAQSYWTANLLTFVVLWIMF